MHSAEKQVTKRWCLEQLNTFSGVQGQTKLTDMCGKTHWFSLQSFCVLSLGVVLR